MLIKLCIMEELPPLGYDVDPETKKYIINEHEASGIYSNYV